MIDGTPRQPGETPLNVPRDIVLIEALADTPWAADAVAVAAGTAPEAVEIGVRELVAAGLNFYHASELTLGRPFNSRQSVIMDTVLSGVDADTGARNITARGFTDVRPTTVRYWAETAGRSVNQRISRFGNQLLVGEGDRLQGTISSLNESTWQLMEKVTYDDRELHAMIRLAAGVPDRPPTRGRVPRAHLEMVARERALLHHLSDSEVAPPAPLPSAVLAEGLSELHRLHANWAEGAGVSPASEPYQIMDRLLRALPDEMTSLRQLLAQYPDRCEEVRNMVLHQLRDLVFTGARLPVIEVARKATSSKKAAQAAGAAAIKAAPPQEVAPKKAAEATTSQPTAAAGTKAAKQTEAAEGAAKADRKSEEFDPEAAGILKAELAAEAGTGAEDLTTAVAAGERAVGQVFDFGDERDQETDREAAIAAAGWDAWVIAAEQDEKEAYAKSQTKGPPITADNVRAYLREIGRTPLLDAVQEVELAKAIEVGLYAAHKLEAENPSDPYSPELRRDLAYLQRTGERAKDLFLQANLRLVVSVAKRYVGRGMTFLDIIQEGNLGLIRAVEKFDYSRGNKFSTYATWWVRQAITRAMADQSRTIRIPVHMVEIINRLRGVQREMIVILGREPTTEELAREMDVTPKKIEEVRAYARDTVSLDQRIGPDSETAVGDLVADTTAPDAHDSATATTMREAIDTVLQTLSAREQMIIRLRFGLDDGRSRTLDEVSAEVGVTRERIRQIETKVMAKLREPSRGAHLRDYLD